jgi:hypothetical protein
LEIKREKDFLFAIIKGKRTSESIKIVTKEICEKCIDNQCSKVLVDVRDFKEHINRSDSFSLASIELPEIIRKSIKKAAILDMEGFENDQIFFENVARYWGHNVQIFTDIDDAKQWLS